MPTVRYNLTKLQYAQIAQLAKWKYGSAAMGPYVSWSVIDKIWRAHVYVSTPKGINKVLSLGPFSSSLEALQALQTVLMS